MPAKTPTSGVVRLRTTSSGSKVFIQFMMFLVVGVLPLIFPKQIHIPDREIVFIIISIALATSILFEIIRIRIEKTAKSTTALIKTQLTTSVILLALFLHYFGYINGPFFVLYLLTVMESFLNLNYLFSIFILTIMISTTSAEFVWLCFTGRVVFGFIPVVEYIIRIISLVFISSYGFVLAKTTFELNLANDDLRVLDQAKNEFVSLASHELRTPMTAIKSYVWMVLNDKAGPVTDTTKKYLEIVSQSTDRLLHLVNDMLDISRIESGKTRLKLETFHFTEILAVIINEFSVKAAEKHITWKTKADDNLPEINSDRDKIIQIMENLVGNAFKYTPEGGSVTVSAAVSGDDLSVTIADTGKGISPEDIPHLFTKFTRLGDKFTSYSQPGTGLGLFISKQYAELLHGTITVESTVGTGSTFTFNLPLDNIKK